MDIQSEGVVPLGSVPDVVGLVGRRLDATGSRILRGRDVRSIRVLVPDPRGLDHNFHDVTIVDMGDEPEASVSLPELSALREQWPPAVFHHMVRLLHDLKLMRADAKKRFRQTKPTPCVCCGRVIKCDMYRHVAKFHLDLAQLWRCPVSWCTVWKGNPQDCMDHVRGVHDVPWIVKTDSDLHLSLTHHYRVPQAWASAYCLSEGLHVEVTGSSASAGGATLGYGVAVS